MRHLKKYEAFMIDIDVNVRKIEDSEECTGEEGCPCVACNDEDCDRVIDLSKSFNEKHEAGVFKKEIDDFCRESMAYLLDDDIYLSTEEEGSNITKVNIMTKDYQINFKKPNIKNLEWDKIKYDFLSFLEMANSIYEISKVKFTTRKLNGDIDTTRRDIGGGLSTTSGGSYSMNIKYFTIDELISEDFNIENLLTINMFIKKKND